MIQGKDKTKDHIVKESFFLKITEPKRCLELAANPKQT